MLLPFGYSINLPAACATPRGCEPRHLLGELVELATVLSPNLALLDEAEFSVAVFLPKALKCVHVLFGHSLHLALQNGNGGECWW